MFEFGIGAVDTGTSSPLFVPVPSGSSESEKSSPRVTLDVSPNPSWGANPLSTWQRAKWADSHPETLLPHATLPIAQRVYVTDTLLASLLALRLLRVSHARPSSLPLPLPLPLSLSAYASGSDETGDSQSVSSIDSGQQWYDCSPKSSPSPSPSTSPSRDELQVPVRPDPLGLPLELAGPRSALAETESTIPQQQRLFNRATTW